VGHEEARGLDRLTDIPALATVNSGVKTSVIEFYPKARHFARIAGWYFKQANFVRSDFVDHDMTRVVALGCPLLAKSETVHAVKLSRSDGLALREEIVWLHANDPGAWAVNVGDKKHGR
jgi:hypothetical protein